MTIDPNVTRDSFQRISDFTLYASHELKTPLTVMRAEVETALAGHESLPASQREWMQSHLDEIQRLANIVDGLTLLTKADAGQVKLDRAPLRVEELMRECFEDAQILAQSQGIEVSFKEYGKMVVIGDRHRLRQLLLNLTDNAVKYNRPRGKILIETRSADHFAEIKISNTGDGIAPELQPRVFERFVRGSDVHSKSIEGSGLGLSISQWIVHAHNGTIEISSDTGKITHTLVRLPLSAD